MSDMKKIPVYLNSVLLPISIYFAIWFLLSVNLIRLFEVKTVDYRFLLRGEKKGTEEIRIVGIDDRSIMSLGRWPWPRSFHAEFLQLLSLEEYKPKIIGYDIFFAEPDTNFPEGDTQLIDISSKTNNICYAYYFNLSEERKAFKENTGEEPGYFSIENIIEKKEGLFKASSATLPLKKLAQKSALGYVNIPPDKDGVLRKIPLVIEYKNKIYPSLSLRIICEFLDINPEKIQINIDKQLIILKNTERTIRIPINKKGEFKINYLCGYESFISDSFIKVMKTGYDAVNLNSNTAQRWLSQYKDKIVLVGNMATGSVDTLVTPFSPNTPGVYIHANIIDNILNEDFILDVSSWLKILIYFVMGVLILLGCWFLKPMKGAFCVLGILIFYLIISIWCFSHKNLCFEIIRPVFGCVALYIVIMLQRFISEEKEKRWIRHAFSHYLSENILADILKNPSKLQLGGRRQNITVLFCDIRNFTSSCEKQPPEKTVIILNEFFEEMTQIILRFNGTLDKYMGDEIMAFFGAPKELNQASLLACKAALEMETKLKILREKWISEDKCPFEMGIGINTGSMIVGNIGSSHIMNYTVIGDEVNLASRVQRLTREFNKTILITEETYKENESHLIADCLGKVAVKGKEKGVVIYALLGIKE